MLKILIVLIFIERLYFACGQDDLYNFLEVGMDDSPTTNISAKCLKETQLMKQSLQNLTLWAMEMWEATARESPSILKGTMHNLGNFDECVGSVKRDFQNSPIRQYCLVTIDIKFNNPKNISDKQSVFDPYGSSLNIIQGNDDISIVDRKKLYWAVCTFDSCSSLDVVTMINNNFEATSAKAKALNLSLIASLEDNMCHQDTNQNIYTPGAIAFLCVLGFLCVVSVVATLYHWYFLINSEDEGENSKVRCLGMAKCFSMIFHCKHLNHKGSMEVGLEALNGIRVVAIIFVIVGHRVGISTQNPMINRELQEREFGEVRGILMRQADIFVDVFFILSGILGVYNILKRTEDIHINFGLIILYRYLRIVPIYAFVMFFITTLLPSTGSGPFWKPIMEADAAYCRENWWTNMLMINNYVNVERMCMHQSWYIPCDFHFFIIATIVCSVLKKKAWRKIALIFLGILLVISTIIPMFITYYTKLHATLRFDYKFVIAPRSDPTFQTTYIKSHTRISSYILGMFGGYVLYKFHKPEEKRFSRKMSTFGTLLSMITLVIFVFATWKVYELDSQINPVASAFFSGIHRLIKSCCIFILILFCVFGSVPFASAFLEWKPWLVLSKLTFGAYLIHLNMQLRDAAMLRHPFYFDDYVCFKSSVSDFVISFGISFLFYIIVEGPSNQMIRVLIMIFKNKKEKENPTKNGTNDDLELVKLNEVSASNINK